ncbi:hypothetical protein ACSCB1_17145 [Streptomyces europaeiscabiei]|uniref:Integral membrane protein n=1 Tax=Streptomyces europaeiscabiei TaxID=146819 RepID=A0ABU4NEA2_9ACTN|nr:hypothetical protein [Streptomyces europaeiscabiei]MDX2525793.1 hypothetical protein [Streptomyces europaeiscabiei]MDX2763282.1 hypothetical protein [Streptomyces europaeiscabiei]MDX2771923.1 hypothetical protein [Streptomyces europaeiscabiei]MDX3543136.1 hypothetical protein [Streptomyces europaeiscabiei]MDX3552952.1 hypothetical protein [Streptomyces europaeiscabiei]
MIRRPVAVVTAFVLFAEGLGIAGLQWFLGTVVDRQKMSLAGLDPDAMSVSTKAGGVVFGLYFVFCGVIALLVAVRDRPAAGLGKILLISVAVVHGLLGALTVGLVGWGAFAFMMVVLGLVLLTLMTYDRQDGVADAVPGGSGDAGGPGGPEQAAPAVPPAPSAS